MTGPLLHWASTPANGVALARLPDYFRPLMMRNIVTDGYPFIDPAVFAGERREGGPEPDPQQALSKPGCILASPSYRDALAAAPLSIRLRPQASRRRHVSRCTESARLHSSSSRNPLHAIDLVRSRHAHGS